MRRKRSFLFSTIFYLLLISMVLMACQPAQTPAAVPTEPEVVDQGPTETEVVDPVPTEAEVVPVEEMTTYTVRVGRTPFFDYQFFEIAQALGWDEELGIVFQDTWLTQSGPAMSALANRSIDLAGSCIVCNYPFYESIPELRNFMTVNQFKGFVVIGRQGDTKSYDEFLAELNDPEEAKVATIQQLQGTTFPIYEANYLPLLTAVLEQGNLTIDDINTINFPDDEKAALAMISGEGDFYIGGLPSEINLLMNHPDDFKLIGGSEILGPAGLWYSNITATEDWLVENEEAALRIMAMAYRYNRYVQEDIDTIMPLVVEAMNAHSGVATSVEDLKFIFDTFLDFRTYQQDAETCYNPDSDLYWETSASYYVERSAELPENADYMLQNPLNEWFDKFLEREDLLEWVDSPLT
jgi:ABC-type nitrate/sulfonate/bicarbonate transport system substrate-binding protein